MLKGCPPWHKLQTSGLVPHLHTSTSTETAAFPNSTGPTQYTANTSTGGLGLPNCTSPSLPNSTGTTQQTHTTSTSRPDIHTDALTTAQARHLHALTTAGVAQHHLPFSTADPTQLRSYPCSTGHATSRLRPRAPLLYCCPCLNSRRQCGHT